MQVLEIKGRPWTTNEGIRWHRMKLDQQTGMWVELSWGLALAKLTRMDYPVTVHCSQVCRAGTTLPDAGAMALVAKAVIDGVVRAGRLPDDSPEWVKAITFYAPIHGSTDLIRVGFERAA